MMIVSILNTIIITISDYVVTIVHTYLDIYSVDIVLNIKAVFNSIF